jgi:peptidoglycan/LPS O-acetylase OafA/YrhL
MVFLSHLQFVNNENKVFNQLYTLFFKEGFLGVSFFFILSGFILSVNYADKLAFSKVTKKEFWIARIARIYPLHLFTLLIALPSTFDDFTLYKVLWLRRFFTNLFLIHSFFPYKDIFYSFNAPSWSISDELFFYLMFPGLILLFQKYRFSKLVCLFFILCIPVGIYLTPAIWIHKLFYINPLVRIGDFVLGILLYYVFVKVKYQAWTSSKTIGTILEILSIALFITFFCFHNSIAIGYRYSCYYWLPMLAIIFVFSLQAGLISNILSNKFLILLGEISFGFYMLHYLVIYYLLIFNTQFHWNLGDYPLIICMFLLTVLASFFTYYFIELPSNKAIKNWYRLRKSTNTS